MQKIFSALILALILLCGRTGVQGQGLAAQQPPIIPAPASAQEWERFRRDLDRWREQTLKETAYDGALYDRADFGWVASAFNCCLLMLYDRAFYDCETGRYTVDEFLDDGLDRFGGYDIVVLWHAYPRIGLDDRNQFDFYRDMPGGLAGLRGVSDALHARGVKVYINYNPWDTGTRREGVSDIDALAGIVKALDADGIFLDTMESGAEEFRGTLDAVRRGVVLESELSLPVEEIYAHHMSWAQNFNDSKVPGVLRNKWLERRHMMHGISRWWRDKTAVLQTAWMNGSGTMIWENVFGQWVGWSPRDSYILRTMSPIQSRFAALFSTGEWIPLADTDPVPDIYANLWQDGDNKLWTLVNRSHVAVRGGLLHVDADPEYLYFDLAAGRRVDPGAASGILSGEIGPRGIGCFWACKKSALPADIDDFLGRMARIASTATSEATSPVLHTVLREVAPTRRYATLPDGMVEAGPFKGEMEVVFTCRENGYYKSVEDDYIHLGPPAVHRPVTLTKQVDIPRLGIDRAPVTNREFKAFLDATGYRPRFGENFLAHWENGRIPAGKEDHPVVYVCLDDARAYAAWAGKRLPREEEWQLAAGGTRQLTYPWGDVPCAGNCNASLDGTTTPVGAFPGGRSPYGAWDMCGNTWELTESEYVDERNCFCILKGGSSYRAAGSEWYFDGGAKPVNFAAKQPLLYPGLDRCATVGFRCAVDLVES